MSDEHASAADALTKAAQAVTGAGTPDQASVVAKPEKWALLAILGAGPAISALLVWLIWILAYKQWPDAVAGQRIEALGLLSLAIAAILGLVVFRLASGNLKRFEARAGPGSISIDTGG